MVLKMPAALSYIFLSLMIASYITQTVAIGPTEQDLEQARKECEAKNKLFCPKYGKCCEHTDFCHEGTCETCFPINMAEDSRLAFCQQLFNNSSPLPMRSNSCDHFLVCRSLFSFKELLNIDEQDFQINWLKQNLSAAQNEIKQLKEELAHQKDEHNKTLILEQKATKKLEEELKLIKQSLNSTFMEKAKLEKEVKEIRDELAHQKDFNNKNQLLERKATKKLEEELKLMKQSLNSTILEKANLEKEVKDMKDDQANQKELVNKQHIMEQKERQKLQDDFLQLKQTALCLGIFGTLAGIGVILATMAFVVVRLVKTDWFRYLFPEQFRPASKSKNYQYKTCATNGEASNELVAQSESHEQCVKTTYFDEFVKSTITQCVQNRDLELYVKMNKLNEDYLPKKDIEERFIAKKDLQESYLDKTFIKEHYLDKEELEGKFGKKDNPKKEKKVRCCTNTPEEAENDVHVHLVEDCSNTLNDLKLRFDEFEKDIKHQLNIIKAKLKVDDGNHMITGAIQQLFLNHPPNSPKIVENEEIDFFNKSGTDQETECLMSEAASPKAVILRQSKLN
ncbi:uncharacterized protein LOC131955825 [Physella acuta]|uniref:uncharacterized protein LOC131955825 n=1 Tax=Physella acuta TaxID=109671 RepID=UPI0027DB1916|nr:uncharacterized protein LOC131955825 [Physella acuta]